MSREVHVRFWESAGVQFPRATHLPLYRLCQIYGRDGVEMSRSTITDMIGNCGLLLAPLAEAVGRYVLKADKVHGDDTPIRALGGKGERAHTGRLWVYVRDDRPSGDKAPPAVWFQYSADRKGEHPARHLLNYRGILQADASDYYVQLAATLSSSWRVNADMASFVNGGRVQSICGAD